MHVELMRVFHRVLRVEARQAEFLLLHPSCLHNPNSDLKYAWFE
jgi:hypothetical protein